MLGAIWVMRETWSGWRSHTWIMKIGGNLFAVALFGLAGSGLWIKDKIANR